MKTLRDFDFKNKRVLVRCDFNVPLDDKGNILDDFRIKKTIPTIEYLREKGAKIILMSHLGDPQEIKNEKPAPYPPPSKPNELYIQHRGRGGAGLKIKNFSLKPITLRLGELLNQKIKFAEDYIGERIGEEIVKMKPGEILLLENLRFHKAEKTNDESFAKDLAKLGDIYINDAFAACHRSHASIVGIPKFLPSGAGFLLEEEIKILSKVLENPWRPFVVIIGGVKIATKIKLIEQFLKKADHLLLGGEIANYILRAKGFCLGKPLLEPEALEKLEKLEKLDLTNPKLHLPVDGVISLEDLKMGLKESYFRTVALGMVRKEEKIYDIGPETIKIFSKIINGPEISFWKGPLEYIKKTNIPKTILWQGPLGMYEEAKFEKGTKEIAQIIGRNYSAFKVAGGGDTNAALVKFGLRDKFDYVSTGGGAMLEFLSDEKLPGIEALK